VLTHAVGSNDPACANDAGRGGGGRRGVLRAVARSSAFADEGGVLQGARFLCRTGKENKDMRQNFTGLEELGARLRRRGGGPNVGLMNLRPNNLNMPVCTAEMLEQVDVVPHLAQALKEGRRDIEAKQVKPPSAHLPAHPSS